MKIAVFLPNWVGDVVMATPAIRALREYYPGALIVAVRKPYVAGVLEGAPWFDDCIELKGDGPWRQRWLGAAVELRRRRVDLAVLFPNSFRSALVARLGRCRRRVGYEHHGRGLILTDRLQPARDDKGRRVPSPILDSYNRLVEHLGARPTRRMELFTTPREEAEADRVWSQARFANYREVICLNPGAAFGSSKYWSVENFAVLARDLANRRGCGVLVLCGPSERDMAQRIQALADRAAVWTLADQTVGIGLTKACVRRCSALVTTDSGPRHFAAAFNRPVVTLFGPTHIAWTETHHARAIHLQKQVACGPCQLRVCPVDHACMKLLQPEEVFEAVDQLLPRSLPRKAS